MRSAHGLAIPGSPHRRLGAVAVGEAEQRAAPIVAAAPGQQIGVAPGPLANEGGVLAERLGQGGTIEEDRLILWHIVRLAPRNYGLVTAQCAYAPGMRRVVLDSNALDPVIDRPDAYEVLREAVETGKLVMLRTHVNIDEVLDTRDADRRERLHRAWTELTQPVPTGAFVIDTSQIDEAGLSDDPATVEALRSGNLKHTQDALIAVTALYEECALVTNEVRRLRNRAREQGIEVLTTAELLAEFGYPSAG